MREEEKESFAIMHWPELIDKKHIRANSITSTPLEIKRKGRQRDFLKLLGAKQFVANSPFLN